MDYEKKYNEALERARSMAVMPTDKAMLEEIFPELRESEDERIRKELIAFFQDDLRGDYWHDLEVGHILAWLEKQKEQKPAEWSEEDERMLSRCIKSIECSKMFAEAKTFKDAKDNEINWLKNRFKFLKSQPKQEWSEGDENALKYIHELISWGYAEKFMDAQTAHDMRKWVNEHISHDTFQNGNSRWKPSEEQMNALNFAITYMFSTKANPTVLRDLYNDLLKLK